jgi:hypothetical protein
MNVGESEPDGPGTTASRPASDACRDSWPEFGIDDLHAAFAGLLQDPAIDAADARQRMCRNEERIKFPYGRFSGSTKLCWITVAEVRDCN